jgi:hypothetical protein
MQTLPLNTQSSNMVTLWQSKLHTSSTDQDNEAVFRIPPQDAYQHKQYRLEPAYEVKVFNFKDISSEVG